MRKVYFVPKCSPRDALRDALDYFGGTANIAVLRDACFLVPERCDISKDMSFYDTQKSEYYSDPLCRAVLFFCFKNHIYNKFLLDIIVPVGHNYHYTASRRRSFNH